MEPLDLHADQRFRLAKEMYLKAIHQLSLEQEVRPADLTSILGVRKSSVSEMIGRLVEEGHVDYQTYGPVTLTPKGLRYAELILRKYTIIRQWLERDLGMEDAHDEACHLEHAFSLEAVERLEEHLERSANRTP